MGTFLSSYKGTFSKSRDTSGRISGRTPADEQAVPAVSSAGMRMPSSKVPTASNPSPWDVDSRNPPGKPLYFRVSFSFDFRRAKE